MKKMVCELCGSRKIIKQSGVFACQDCGTEYSLEEARKLLVECGDETGVTSNTVGGQVIETSNNSKLNNLYTLARRAKDEGNSENAKKYYDMILIENPDDWEATFYSTYYRVYSCRIMDIASEALSFITAFDSVFLLIDRNLSDNEKKRVVSEIVTRSTMLAKALSSAAINHYNGIDCSIRDDHKTELYQRLVASRGIDLALGDVIASRCSTTNKELAKYAVIAYRAGIDLYKTQERYITGFFGSSAKMDVSVYEKKIEKLDPEGVKKEKDAVAIKNCEEQLRRARSYREHLNNQTFSSTAMVVLWMVSGICLLFALVSLNNGTIELFSFGCFFAILLFSVGILFRPGKAIEKRDNELIAVESQISKLERELEKLKSK